MATALYIQVIFSKMFTKVFYPCSRSFQLKDSALRMAIFAGILLACFQAYLQADDKKLIEQAIRASIDKPVGALTEADFKRVKRLNLDGLDISDLSYLSKLTELESLLLSYNKVTDLKPLAGMKKLKQLFLNDNLLVDIGPLGGLSSLEWLYLNRNKIKVISPLGGLKSLKGINLAGNPIPASEIDKYRRKWFMPAPSPGEASSIVRNPLHHLSWDELPQHRGTAGLDPGAEVEPPLVFKGSTESPFPFGALYHLDDKRWWNGFYFVGPGRILPECALRINWRDQIGTTRSETRPGLWTDKHWSGQSDCSAFAVMARDDENLKLLFKVRDDKFVTTKNPDLWVNDSLEVFFDVRHNDLGKGAYERGVFQMLLGPKEDGSVKIWFKGIEVPKITAGCEFVKNGWEVTVLIPLSELENKHFYPVNAFNFEWIVNDSDTPGERDTTMIWSGHEFSFFDARRFGHMRSVRRGFYFEGKDSPPEEAIMRMGDRLHARIRCQDWKRNTWRPGGGKWDSAQDCSAEAWLRKSDKGFHFHINVTDDKRMTSHPLPWNRDGVEIHFDFRPKGQRGRAVPNYDPGIGGGYKEPPGIEIPGVVQIFCPLPSRGGKVTPDFGRYLHSRKPTTAKTDIPGIRVDSRLTSNGYSMDAFIPFKGLKVNHLSPGETFNFDFVVNDADNSKGRDSCLTWSGWLLNYQNPSSYARMEPLP